MKIGIMTFHAALNSGAVLQAYALQTYLKKQGHDVEFINFQEKKKYTIRDFVAKKISKVWYKWMDRLNGYRFRKRGDFGNIIDRGQTLYKTLDELKSNPPVYDVYIAGSDQIWNVPSNHIIKPAYYLAFGSDHVKRIAYAASMGQCKVPPFLDTKIARLLQKFDAISLRETKAVNYVQSILGEAHKIYHTPDPTLLIDASDYEKLLKPQRQHKEPYIASYMLAELGDEQKQTIKFIQHEKGLQIINLRNPDTCIRLSHARNRIVTPTEWLSYMYHAEFTICCSFHAVVFSLIFHKPFIVVTPHTNERISSLLAPMDLTNRIVRQYNKNSIQQILATNIEWHRIDQMIGIERSKGTQFLKDNLT